ncbi:LexA family protein [Spirosoma utsteinense]|uniref:DNA polymerase V n=1 Tax=Spirosoma utsteinense TaxID=2585773 RepID=A0ABR6W7U8_9BACT|nr:translesion error-prone DNA polymerase V autoproteolytic subunit [Spirosoma utsteinense]MBC3789030.1 DNA polymerase V [Spirosoma utsteinense]MBC3792644.1 DNA polymerase V [Spirosoma utsteinense]
MIEAIDAIPLENIYRIDPSDRTPIPLYSSGVQAGFPSPAENHIERRLNLQDLCVPNIETSYFVKATGESMIGDYIFPGSILVVDSAVPVQTGSVIVAWVNGECCVKRFVRQGKQIMLESSNERYLPIYVHLQQDQFLVLGVVTYVVSKPPRYVRPR